MGFLSKLIKGHSPKRQARNLKKLARGHATGLQGHYGAYTKPARVENRKKPKRKKPYRADRFHSPAVDSSYMMGATYSQPLFMRNGRPVSVTMRRERPLMVRGAYNQLF